ncbi:unnamed protein product [Candida verbasci]|uniref:Dynein intermediate chain n=1 Tax=Candida verbasci TaxID=1227364 RepID=A0A9W4TSI3_9ASCO|nr:unnamed protein product [Candida verbasci]
MDRQQLLEQKRQRLKELQERRNVKVITPEPIKKVDISTQTIELIEKKVEAPKELNRYDKSIQTVEIIDEIPVKEIKKEVQFTNKNEVSELELNKALISSIKLVNKFKKLHEIELTATATETTKLDKRVVEIGGKLEIYNDYLAVVKEYEVIVYNRITYLPEHHLISITPIKDIVFDKFKNRVIGVLKYGKICIWELNDELKALPVLTSPIINPVFIKQLKINENDSILAITETGHLQIWSSNILKSPKKSMKLTEKAITDAVYLGTDEIVGKEEYNLYLVSYGSLLEGNNMVHEGPKSIIYSTVKFKNFIISCHSDWTLKIWKDDKTPYKIIPTTNSITKIIPNGERFITVGHLRKYVVELWDLSIKLFSPIAKIDEFDQIESVIFNDDVIISTPDKHIIYSLDNLDLETNEFDDGLML